jgi:hypothetical protein
MKTLGYILSIPLILIAMLSLAIMYAFHGEPDYDGPHP